jgi:hypothetical protein
MRILGVDPGCSATGWAILSEGGELLEAGTLSAGDIPAAIAQIARTGKITHAIVQVPVLPSEPAPRWNPGSGVALAKNAEVAGEIVGFLRGIGLPVEKILATRCRRIGMGASQRVFEADFGTGHGRISEHARDAAFLAKAALHRARGNLTDA